VINFVVIFLDLLCFNDRGCPKENCCLVTKLLGMCTSGGEGSRCGGETKVCNCRAGLICGSGTRCEKPKVESTISLFLDRISG